MQSLRIASRLAWRNLRRRPGRAALLLVTLTIATGTLGAGMWLYGSADGPWDRVWKATNGFHVSVAYYHDRDTPRLQLDRALRKASALGEEPGVVASLQSSARGPKRPARLARLAARIGLPVTGVLGLRSAWRRPGRLLTNAAGLALAIAMIVVALGLTRSLDLLAVRPVGHQDALSGAAVDALYEQVRAIIAGTAGLLLVLGTINAFIVATFAARDSARNHAVMRAMGATPRQTAAALIVSQFGACALAIGAGIPLGLGLWQLMAGGDLPRVEVSWAALLALLAAVPVAFAGIVSIPALWLARRPIAPQLAYE
jgi:putative ABC transport system permease protein